MRCSCRQFTLTRTQRSRAHAEASSHAGDALTSISGLGLTLEPFLSNFRLKLEPFAAPFCYRALETLEYVPELHEIDTLRVRMDDVPGRSGRGRTPRSFRTPAMRTLCRRGFYPGCWLTIGSIYYFYDSKCQTVYRIPRWTNPLRWTRSEICT